jgi:glucans biosynthesis protein
MRRQVRGGGGTGALGAAIILAFAISFLGSADVCAGSDEAQRETAVQFSAATVQKLAKELAERPYQQPEAPAQSSTATSYEAYRTIRFRPEQAIWRSEQLGFELHPLPLGWLYKEPIELYVVEDGVARRVTATADMFQFGGDRKDATPSGLVELSGFRINAPLNRPDKHDEIIVFQGASYFRAVSRGQVYGTSARGLALDTAEPKGEEFPAFRKFWVEKPRPGTGEIVVHALLDSPSTTGAYRFLIHSARSTEVKVDAILFPRVPLTHVGIAPLTSMHLLSPMWGDRVSDFRAAVHDADGLAIENGRGERIWRPLSNPRSLQISAFLDENPKGFGLMQRERTFAAYQDLEAHYERRPGVWVQPISNWGLGNVILVEIPTEEEIHDNIVAFWRPAAPLAPGKAHSFSYRLLWVDATPNRQSGPWVRYSRSGSANAPDRKAGKVRFAVDYVDASHTIPEPLPRAIVSVSRGVVSAPVVEANREVGGVRVSFLLDPQNAESVELRLEVKDWGERNPEVWLYRWSKTR